MAAKIGICCQSLASRARPLAHCIIPVRGGKAQCLETHARTKKKALKMAINQTQRSAEQRKT